MIRLVPFDRNYLDRSWDWLRDPEVKAMTMAPDFTREEQLAFFETLPGRSDYLIWGVEGPDGSPVGVSGIKHVSGSDGESWCYIGERRWWGQGIGGQILEACEVEARKRGITHLTMTALETNERSLRAYGKMGFELLSRDDEAGTVTLQKIVD